MNVQVPVMYIPFLLRVFLYRVGNGLHGFQICIDRFQVRIGHPGKIGYRHDGILRTRVKIISSFLAANGEFGEEPFFGPGAEPGGRIGCDIGRIYFEAWESKQITTCKSAAKIRLTFCKGGMTAQAI